MKVVSFGVFSQTSTQLCLEKELIEVIDCLLFSVFFDILYDQYIITFITFIPTVIGNCVSMIFNIFTYDLSFTFNMFLYKFDS